MPATELTHRPSGTAPTKSEKSIGHDLPGINEIRSAIPAHCFQRSVPKSFLYIFLDGCLLVPLAMAAWTFLPHENMGVGAWLAWVMYALVQGTVATGWWVIAHECGHQAFSDYSWLNHTVGYVLHTFLLVPFFSWQYSHAKHHSKTNHLLDGETHTPATRKGSGGMKALHDAIGEDGFALFQLIAHLLLGWPLYLLFNSTGARRKLDGSRIKGEILDHYRPNSALFPDNWRTRVAVSTVGIFAMLCVVFSLGQTYGHGRIALMYWGPYLVVNAWLVGYTWLQHSHHSVPHFGEDEWTWLKGAALGTIDRPYGVFDLVHHHIGSTHVCHHIFPRIPHYNAVEATQALKKVLGAHYNYDGSHFTKAAWQTAKTCHYVDGVEGVQYYKSFSKSVARENCEQRTGG